MEDLDETNKTIPPSFYNATTVAEVEHARDLAIAMLEGI